MVGGLTSEQPFIPYITMEKALLVLIQMSDSIIKKLYQIYIYIYIKEIIIARLGGIRYNLSNVHNFVFRFEKIPPPKKYTL